MLNNSEGFYKILASSNLRCGDSRGLSSFKHRVLIVKVRRQQIYSQISKYARFGVTKIQREVQREVQIPALPNSGLYRSKRRHSQSSPVNITPRTEPS